MKKFIISHLEILVAIFTMIASFIFFNISKTDNSASIVLSELQDSVSYYKNKNGELIAQKRSVEIGSDGLKKYAEELGIDNEKLKDQVGNYKNIVSHLKAEIRAVGKGSAIDSSAQVTIDSDSSFEIKGSYEWTNNYLDINNNYTVSGKYGVNGIKNVLYKSEFNYKYNTSINTTYYWKRDTKWKVWKPKYVVVDILLDDPNAITYDVTSVVIREEKKFYEKTSFKLILGFVGGSVFTLWVLN